MEVPEITRRLRALRAAVLDHKAAIRRHRAALQHAKTTMVAFEEELRRLGIAVRFTADCGADVYTATDTDSAGVEGAIPHGPASSS